MEELLILLIQGFFQLMGEFLSNSTFTYGDMPLSEEDRSFWIALFVFLAGLGIGTLSLHFWHDVVLRRSAVRISALFFSPIFSGWLSRQTGKVLSSASTSTFFWLAFLFNLGICLIRFGYCHRPA